MFSSKKNSKKRGGTNIIFQNIWQRCYLNALKLWGILDIHESDFSNVCKEYQKRSSKDLSNAPFVASIENPVDHVGFSVWNATRFSPWKAAMFLAARTLAGWTPKREFSLYRKHWFSEHYTTKLTNVAQFYLTRRPAQDDQYSPRAVEGSRTPSHRLKRPFLWPWFFFTSSEKLTKPDVDTNLIAFPRYLFWYYLAQ